MAKARTALKEQRAAGLITGTKSGERQAGHRRTMARWNREEGVSAVSRPERQRSPENCVLKDIHVHPQSSAPISGPEVFWAGTTLPILGTMLVLLRG